jgi:hypothetical protein
MVFDKAIFDEVINAPFKNISLKNEKKDYTQISTVVYYLFGRICYFLLLDFLLVI